MKILMLQGGFGTGGAEKIMALLAAHRLQLGDQVDVAGMFMPPEGSFFPYPADVTLHVLAAEAPPNKLLQLRRLLAIRRLVDRLKPDLIISFLTKVNCLSLLATPGTGVPVVISERNNPRLQSNWFWRRLQSALMPRAAGIVMQTRAARDDLPSLQGARAHVIPNLCRPVHFEPPPPSQTCRFVAAGRLDRQKGFDLLIEAFSRIPSGAPADLTIFGQGQQQTVLEQLIERRGLRDRVRLAGISPTPAAWMSAGDVVVVTSRFEGFCNVVAEATCSGLAIISFDCAFGPAEMIRDGVNGILLPVGDVDALTQAMTRVATDPQLRRKLASAPHLAARQLDPGCIMGLWDQLIEQASTRTGERRGDHRPANTVSS